MTYLKTKNLTLVICMSAAVSLISGCSSWNHKDYEKTPYEKRTAGEGVKIVEPAAKKLQPKAIKAERVFKQNIMK